MIVSGDHQCYVRSKQSSRNKYKRFSRFVEGQIFSKAYPSGGGGWGAYRAHVLSVQSWAILAKKRAVFSRVRVYIYILNNNNQRVKTYYVPASIVCSVKEDQRSTGHL